MKLFILFIIIILAALGVATLTHYQERMTSYNKHMCAVYGYREDCKTPLAESERLK